MIHFQYVFTGMKKNYSVKKIHIIREIKNRYVQKCVTLEQIEQKNAVNNYQN